MTPENDHSLLPALQLDHLRALWEGKEQHHRIITPYLRVLDLFAERVGQVLGDLGCEIRASWPPGNFGSYTVYVMPIEKVGAEDRTGRFVAEGRYLAGQPPGSKGSLLRVSFIEEYPQIGRGDIAKEDALTPPYRSVEDFASALASIFASSPAQQVIHWTRVDVENEKNINRQKQANSAA